MRVGGSRGRAKSFCEYLRLGFSLKTEVILEGLGEEVGSREGWESWAVPGLLHHGLQLLSCSHLPHFGSQEPLEIAAVLTQCSVKILLPVLSLNH